MKRVCMAVLGVLGAALLVSCASTEVTGQQKYAGQSIARPNRIIVYNFRATPTDISPASAVTGYYHKRETPQSADEISLGRQLGAHTADELVGRLLKAGIEAQRAGNGPPPTVGDVLITGQFISIDKGSRGKRIVIGFGKGGAELHTHVEGYLVTETGHRLLGTRKIGTAGGKSAGLGVSGIMAVATASPVGLIANGAMKLRSETGSESLRGAAERTGKRVAEEIQRIYRERGWI